MGFSPLQCSPRPSPSPYPPPRPLFAREDKQALCWGPCSRHPRQAPPPSRRRASWRWFVCLCSGRRRRLSLLPSPSRLVTKLRVWVACWGYAQLSPALSSFEWTSWGHDRCSRTLLRPAHALDPAAALPSRCVRVWVDVCGIPSRLTPHVPRLQDRVGRARFGWVLSHCSRQPVFCSLQVM